MRDFLNHLFLPRESNNHRSKLLHHQSLILATAVLLVGLSVFSFVQKDYPSVLGLSADVSIEDLLVITNQKRQEKGVPPLVLNTELSQAAEMKAQHMFAHNYWAHVAPDGTTPWVFIKNANYEYLYAGENLARGYTTASETINAWMASPTHKDNLLSSNYKEIGFAVKSGSLTGSDTILIVQMFGSKYGSKTEASPAEVPSAAGVSSTLTVSSEPSPQLSGVIVGQSDVLPTHTLSQPLPTSGLAVAAVQNNPLIDTKSVKWNISIFVLLLFITVFIIDAVIVERKKIVRLVSHNVDHIIFLTIILIAGILIGKGLIL